MIAYTFRTFKSADTLQDIFGNIFTFSRLKDDLIIFQNMLEKHQPDYILGVAATRGHSRMEPLAVNRFNRNFVSRHCPAQLRLHTPLNLPEGLMIAAHPTTSFCNWTMYRLQAFILQTELDTKLMFMHVNVKQLSLLEAIKQL